MKLEDFGRAQSLVSERDYLAKLHKNMKVCVGKLTFAGLDIRPDLVEKMVPEMRAVIAQQAKLIDEKLAEIGVTIE